MNKRDWEDIVFTVVVVLLFVAAHFQCRRQQDLHGPKSTCGELDPVTIGGSMVIACQ